MLVTQLAETKAVQSWQRLSFLRKDTGVFESFGRFIIVLLDKSVTSTLYAFALFINNPIRENIHTYIFAYHDAYIYICAYICPSMHYAYE